MQKTIAPLHAFAYNELAKGLMVQKPHGFYPSVYDFTCAIFSMREIQETHTIHTDEHSSTQKQS